MEISVKYWLSLTAIALTFIGYAPYFKDILSRKTRPHVFSWLLWGIVTFIIFALQISAGAGDGAGVTAVVATICFLVALLSLKNGRHDITQIDCVFFVLALLCIPLWLIVNQPIISIVILCSIDILGFAPTVRKSWQDPYSETLSLYVISFFRHTISVMALNNYNLVTMLFPITWTVVNAAFSIMLISRRKKNLPRIQY